MAIVRASISNLMDVDLDEVAHEEWQNTTHKPILDAIFRVIDSTKQEEIFQTVGGMGLLAEKSEGEDMTNRIFRQGYKTTFTHKTLAMYAQLSMEAVDDEQYGVISNLPESMVRSADATYNYYMSRIFGQSTSTSEDFITGGDGKALLATDHPLAVSGGTCANKPSTDVDLGAASLWDAIDGFYGMLDDAGKPLAINPKYLLIPHQELQKAHELVDSEKYPESAKQIGPYTFWMN